MFITLGTLGMAELALRQCGYDQFPLYDVSADIGYLPKPNQAGNFADRYTWSLNERSMLNEPWFPDRDHGVLLLGNSLVWGEVRMLPKDKLGAQLQAIVGGPWRIWSVGAGSWGNLNEITYLQHNRDVVANIHSLIWIINSGSFSERSQWRSDLTHPRSKPWFLSVYLLKKALAPWISSRLPALNSAASSALPLLSDEPKHTFIDYLGKTRADLRSRITIVWYPNLDELTRHNAEVEGLAAWVRETATANDCAFVDLRSDVRWKASCYRDSIHPSVDGNAILARILQERARL